MHTPLTLPLPITSDTEAIVLSDTESEPEEVPTEAPASGDASLGSGEQWIVALLCAVDEARDAVLDALDGRMDDLNGRIDDLNGRIDDLNGRMATLEASQTKTHKLMESLHAAMPLSKMHLVRAPPEPACLVASLSPTSGPLT